MLAYKAVAVTAENKLFPWTNVEWATDPEIKLKYALPKTDRRSIPPAVTRSFHLVSQPCPIVFSFCSSTEWLACLVSHHVCVCEGIRPNPGGGGYFRGPIRVLTVAFCNSSSIRPHATPIHPTSSSYHHLVGIFPRCHPPEWDSVRGLQGSWHNLNVVDFTG